MRKLRRKKKKKKNKRLEIVTCMLAGVGAGMGARSDLLCDDNRKFAHLNKM